MERTGLAASVRRAVPDLTRLSKSRCEHASRLRWPRRTRFSSSGEVIVGPDQEEARLRRDAGGKRAGLVAFRPPFGARHDVRVDGPGEHALRRLQRPEQIRVAHVVADHHDVDVALAVSAPLATEPYTKAAAIRFANGASARRRGPTTPTVLTTSRCSSLKIGLCRLA